MLTPINLQLKTVVGHHLGWVDFEVGAIWKNKMAAMAGGQYVMFFNLFVVYNCEYNGE